MLRETKGSLNGGMCLVHLSDGTGPPPPLINTLTAKLLSILLSCSSVETPFNMGGRIEYRHFTKDDVQVASRYQQRCSASCAIGKGELELQWATLSRSYVPEKKKTAVGQELLRLSKEQNPLALLTTV